MRDIRKQQILQRQPSNGLSPTAEARLRGRLRKNAEVQEAIKRFKMSTEGPRSSKSLITVVTLKGVDKESVERTVASLKADKPHLENLEFEFLQQPDKSLELPKDTQIVVFVANGSIEGVDKLLLATKGEREKERIASVLISERKVLTDRVDHSMSFEDAMGKGNIFQALKAAFYHRRYERLFPAPATG